MVVGQKTAWWWSFLRKIWSYFQVLLQQPKVDAFPDARFANYENFFIFSGLTSTFTLAENLQTLSFDIYY